MLYDENEDILNPISIITDGYEIPIPDAMIPNNNNSFGHSEIGVEKERTFSSSSTVSEQSIIPINNNNSSSNSNCTNSFSKNNDNNSSIDNINTNQILKVALPNSKEDCSSNEKLLLKMQPVIVAGQHSSKIRPFYTNAKAEEVINGDGKTMM